MSFNMPEDCGECGVCGRPFYGVSCCEDDAMKTPAQQTVTVEKIGNKSVTIIRRPFDPEAVRESLAMGVPAVVEAWYQGQIISAPIVEPEPSNGWWLAFKGLYKCADDGDINHTLTILPALFSFPTDEEVFAYEAQGLRVFRSSNKGTTHRAIFGTHRDSPVTHVILAEGECVEVAIEGAE